MIILVIMLAQIDFKAHLRAAFRIKLQIYSIPGEDDIRLRIRKLRQASIWCKF
jgi:hypothetical protein